MNIMETTVELTILPPAETGLALLEDDLSAAKDYLAQEKAESTRLAYQSDFRIFAAYCSDRGLSPMPASPEAVMGFISAEGEGRGRHQHHRAPDRRHPLRAPPGRARATDEQRGRECHPARHPAVYRHGTRQEGTGDGRSAPAHARRLP